MGAGGGGMGAADVEGWQTGNAGDDVVAPMPVAANFGAGRLERKWCMEESQRTRA